MSWHEVHFLHKVHSCRVLISGKGGRRETRKEGKKQGRKEKGKELNLSAYERLKAGILQAALGYAALEFPGQGSDSVTAKVRVKPGLSQNSPQQKPHWAKRPQNICLGDFLITLLTKKFTRQVFIT